MKRYQAIDLILLAIILCMLEFASRLALRLFPTEVFTFSVTLPVALIVLMRWNAWGVLHALLGGLVYGLLNGGDGRALGCYIIGNAFIALNLLWFRALPKERISRSTILTVLFTISGWLYMETGRALVAALLGAGPFFGIWVRYMTTDALTGAMSVIILLIAARRGANGCVFQDQRTFLAALAANGDVREAVKEGVQPCA